MTSSSSAPTSGQWPSAQAATASTSSTAGRSSSPAQENRTAAKKKFDIKKATQFFQRGLHFEAVKTDQTTIFQSGETSTQDTSTKGDGLVDDESPSPLWNMAIASLDEKGQKYVSGLSVLQSKCVA